MPTVAPVTVAQCGEVHFVLQFRQTFNPDRAKTDKAIAMLTKGFEIEQVANKVVVAKVSQRELTGPEAAELVTLLTDRMRYDGATLFVLDLAPVEFIASACIGALVSFLQDLEHVRGRVSLARCGPNVQFLFKVTKLDSIFTLYDDLDEACRQIVHG